MPTVSNKQSHHSSYNFYKLLHLQRAPMHILNFVCFLSAAGCIVWMTKQKCEQNLSQMATCKIRHLVTQRKVEIAIRWWPANWPCKAVNRQRCSSNQPLTFRPLWWMSSISICILQQTKSCTILNTFSSQKTNQIGFHVTCSNLLFTYI